MNEELLSIVVDLGPTVQTIDFLMDKEKTYSGRSLAINYFEVGNDLLLNLRNREINRHFNQIHTHEVLWQDNRLIEMTLSTLEAQLVSNAIHASLIMPICQSMYPCLSNLALSVHEVMTLNPDINRVLYYNFKIVQRTGISQFLLIEKPAGDDSIEVTFEPWVEPV